MSRDIVDISISPDGLVIATGIEAEPADELTRVEVKDADVTLGDEELDRTPFWPLPMPMWWSFESWRRVTVPFELTLSWRMRKWVSRPPSPPGRAFTRAL